MRFTVRRLLAAFLVLLGTAALSIAGPTGSAQAAPASCEYPAAACACPTLSVSTTAPDPGETITVSGTDFVSNKRITLVLKPVRNTNSDRVYTLKTLRTSADGTFVTRVTMPKTAIGTFDIHAVNGTPTGAVTAAGIACPADPSTRLRIGGDDNNRTPDNNETTTAFTGFNMLWLLLLAAALVAVGVYANRRGNSKNQVRSIHG